jgi:hypothetical protein
LWLYVADLYCITSLEVDENKEDKMGEECSRRRGDRNAQSALAGKPEGERPLGRPMHIIEDNIKMDLKETMVGRGLHLCGSEHGTFRAVVNSVINLRVQ